jgi:nucleoside-diphosphate-sugar epimerase
MGKPVVSQFPKRVLILGCGFTGARVARALLDLGVSVVATKRDPREGLHRELELQRFDALNPTDFLRLPALVEGCDAVVCSIPTLRAAGELLERVPDIVDSIRGRAPRCIYISTTGVYGPQHQINEDSLPAPGSRRQLLRIAAEDAVISGFSSPLVLRPAAIYGPGRGVHVSIREGRYRLTGEGDNYISRIHVEDLAAHLVAALGSNLEGAWPVADQRACSQREMAAFCAELLGLPMPGSAEPGSVSETLRANRRVDGSAIRRRLGISLRYPTYREGVPASMEEEARESDRSC